MTESDYAAVMSPLRYRDGVLRLLDQRRLPSEEMWLDCHDDLAVADAIAAMVVRGAPAIGCAAAYGVALAAHAAAREGVTPDAFMSRIETAIKRLAATRPTAVNLFWALDQMRSAAALSMAETGVAGAAPALEQRAIAIHDEDIAMCVRIGAAGADLISADATVLTHCNAGALATGGYGTALGVIRAARERGNNVRVIANETRPYLQGARLTAWELARDGFDVTIIPDGAAAALLQRGEIDCVVVGADRIAANGDVANKIGTYGVALAARAAEVPFLVAAPVSTIDPETPDGAAVPIEERDGSELWAHTRRGIAPPGARARYPGFDITPAPLVSAIVTDRGVAKAPYPESISRILQTD
jgi:methylthioribose-1-phosphate isomerase